MANLFNVHWIVASLIWGSVGFIYVWWGRKAGEIIPAIGGLALIAFSYVVSSALWMSVDCVGALAIVYSLQKLGYW